MRHAFPLARRHALVTLATLLACAATAQPVPEAPAAPSLQTVIERDSVYVVGSENEGIWTYEISSAEGDGDLWIDLRDPYGGRTRTPTLYHSYVDGQAKSALRGESGLITFTLTRMEAFVVLGLMAIGAIAFVVAPSIGLRRRYLRERERRQRLQEVALQLAESREDERKRIARDLHDGPLQDLHALHMQLGLAADALAGSGDGPQPQAARVRGAQDEAHTVIGELRGIAEALRPPALGPFGLAAALRALVARFLRRQPGIEVELDLVDDGQTIDEPVRLALFRIAQEGLANAAKHGRPRTVSIRLHLPDDAVELVVEDDGTGFAGDPEDPALAATGHFGFLGMRERASSIGGVLSIGASEQGGLCVRARVPR